MFVYEDNEETINQFFRGKESVTRGACDTLARNIIVRGGSENDGDGGGGGGEDWKIEAIGTQGSLSYTVVCTNSDCSAAPPEAEAEAEAEAESCTKKAVISFRRAGSRISRELIEVAKGVHGVPDAIHCGDIGRGGEALSVYRMPFLPGVPCAAVYPQTIRWTGEEEDRYFARAWNNPQPVNHEANQKDLDFRQRCLSNMKASGKFPYLDPVIADIEAGLPSYYTRHSWPQVLTHDDLSLSNLLVDESTFAITGIVDWTAPFIGPFGLDLSFLRILGLRSEYNDNEDGEDDEKHTNYESAERLEDVFWEEFWDGTVFEGCWIEKHSFRGYREASDYPGFLRRMNRLGHMRLVETLRGGHRCRLHDGERDVKRLCPSLRTRTPKLVDTLTRFVNGYIAWHLCDKWYRVMDIYEHLVGESESESDDDIRVKFRRYHKEADAVDRVDPDE
ncbi:hypothetical protein F4778DRAFT_778322 [Xylariomycetidae sp. FL2044]|nr:hypothetical protein F4778DRAFT_778322 [Xylariomycetidae sp. FL2044]